MSPENALGRLSYRNVFSLNDTADDRADRVCYLAVFRQ